ncbi:MAG: DMT family transporter [Arcobacteraceae bacterium]
MESQNKNVFYILMFFAMFAWGLSWVSAKFVSTYINEYELIFLRNILTLCSLIPILIFTKKYFKINLKSFALSFLASIFMILYMKYYFLGLQHGTASLGGTFVTTLIPINTFILMALFFKKKTSRKDIFALVLGVTGVLTIIHIWTFNIEQIFALENIYFFLAALLWSLITITSSKSTQTSPIVFSFYMYIISTILVLLFFLDVKTIAFETFDRLFWFNMFIISIVSTTFATTIYFIGIEKLGAKEVTSFIFLVPFFAIATSAIFLKEEITVSIIIGTALTIVALAILNNIVVFNKNKKADLN